MKRSLSPVAPDKTRPRHDSPLDPVAWPEGGFVERMRSDHIEVNALPMEAMPPQARSSLWWNLVCAQSAEQRYPTDVPIERLERDGFVDERMHACILARQRITIKIGCQRVMTIEFCPSCGCVTKASSEDAGCVRCGH